MFLNRGEDEIVDRIEARIAKYTAIPKENGEGLQILHYQVSQLWKFRLAPSSVETKGIQQASAARY